MNQDEVQENQNQLVDNVAGAARPNPHCIRHPTRKETQSAGTVFGFPDSCAMRK
jgi:hypothetical protein